MEITQRRLSNRAIFSFGDDELRYTMQDSSGRHTFGIEYGAIPDDVGEFEEKNGWYLKAGIFWVGLGLVQIGMRWAETGRLRGSIWFALGVICIIIYWFFVTRYTTIDTGKGRIFIIKDKNHDRVLTELEERRKAQWRAWHGEVDLENDPTKEIAKFRWLREYEAITESEYADAIDQISRYHGLRPRGSRGGAIDPWLN